MPKSIHSDPYRILLTVLRDARVDRGIRQEDLVKPLRMDQSTISRIEQGERRLDIVELRAYCQAIDWTLAACVTRWEHLLRRDEPSARKEQRTKR